MSDKERDMKKNLVQTILKNKLTEIDVKVIRAGVELLRIRNELEHTGTEQQA